MAHAIQWADEVIVVDKSSTDGTADIAESLGARVQIRPFSLQGHEDPRPSLALAHNDWIWFLTPGEIPTRKLVTRAKEVLDESGDKLDLVVLPKKIYSFGIHDSRSPWSVSYQPFLVHRGRVKVSQQIHANFSGVGITIPFEDDCYVLHPTHPNFESFVESHISYIRKEAEAEDLPGRICSAASMISKFDFGKPTPDDELFGQMCAWRFYHWGTMLACWCKLRGVSADSAYAAMRASMLAAEWG